MTPRRKTARPRPVTRTFTEEQYGADMANRAAADRSAALTVADRAIAAGCQGPGCKSGHCEHVAGIIQSLRILGLMDDPEAGARSRNYHWGAAKKSSKGEQ